MEHQFVGRAFVGGVIPENRGFGIGGSSSINTMVSFIYLKIAILSELWLKSCF